MCSGANFGEGFAGLSIALGTDDILERCGVAEGVATGAGGIGSIGMLTTPGVAGAGGWSDLDGKIVLIENVNVDPLPGTPFALMSPPCS